jgi:hypothetical protein
MSEYKIVRLLTVKEYERLREITTSFGYNFQDGDTGEIILNKLLIPDVISMTNNNATTGIEETKETSYKLFHNNRIAGIEVDEDPTGLTPLKERSWIVFGKKAE